MGFNTRQPRAENILIVEDDRGLREAIRMLLDSENYNTVLAGNVADGSKELSQRGLDLVITDLKLPDSSGLEIIHKIKESGGAPPTILMTGYASIDSAIEALRYGAVDYIIKPFNNDDFLYSVRRALREKRIQRENAVLKRNLRKFDPSETIIGESENIRHLLHLIHRVGPSDANVLIEGESGTGKELVARAIHHASARAAQPFVAVNCAAVPMDLIESEFFGHTKGAFTGAAGANEGLVREASGGTLFLDEISELDASLQVKLLRVIQEKEVRPVGGRQTYWVDTRFIAATNKDLELALNNGEFRRDLYYRLNVINIHVPPLRERAGDIERLVMHFIEHHGRKLGRRINGVDKDAQGLLRSYHWPGNVRELENLIERAIILADSDTLSRDDFPDIRSRARENEHLDDADRPPLAIEDYIRHVILRYQQTHSENQIADMLGIGRKALWSRRRRWGLYRDSLKDKGE